MKPLFFEKAIFCETEFGWLAYQFMPHMELFEQII
jgi:hypothetical protein